MRLCTESFAAAGTCDAEREPVRADSSRFWARLQGAPVRAGDSDAGTIWIFTDITESRRHREQLSWSASHDELTGLVKPARVRDPPGRGARRTRHSEPAAALFIDLDRFKAVNDSSGHAAGDVLLKDIAAILVARARAHDTVARLGGDEFAVLLRGSAAGGRALRRQHLHPRGRAPARVGARRARPGAVGGRQHRHRGHRRQLRRREAGAARRRRGLLEAKRAGRGTVRTFRRATGSAPLAVE